METRIPRSILVHDLLCNENLIQCNYQFQKYILSLIPSKSSTRMERGILVSIDAALQTFPNENRSGSPVEFRRKAGPEPVFGRKNAGNNGLTGIPLGRKLYTSGIPVEESCFLLASVEFRRCSPQVPAIEY